jgi:hypothetical protein
MEYEFPVTCCRIEEGKGRVVSMVRAETEKMIRGRRRGMEKYLQKKRRVKGKSKVHIFRSSLILLESVVGKSLGAKMRACGSYKLAGEKESNFPAPWARTFRPTQQAHIHSSTNCDWIRCVVSRWVL